MAFSGSDVARGRAMPSKTRCGLPGRERSVPHSGGKVSSKDFHIGWQSPLDALDLVNQRQQREMVVGNYLDHFALGNRCSILRDFNRVETRRPAKVHSKTAA